MYLIDDDISICLISYSSAVDLIVWLIVRSPVVSNINQKGSFLRYLKDGRYCCSLNCVPRVAARLLSI